MFDSNCDGIIDKRELMDLLNITNKRNLTSEQLRQIADCTIARWDAHGRGGLTFSEFKELLCASAASLSL